MIEPPVHPRKDQLLQLSLTLAVVLTLLTLGWLSWTVNHSYRFVTGELPAIRRMGELRGQILLFDDILTMSARMAAATGEPEWEARYRRFDPQLNQALEEASRLAPAVAHGQAAAQTTAANTKLVTMENRAFELVRQGQQARAQQLLSSEEYEDQKRIYAAGMAEFSRLLLQTIDSVRAQEHVQTFWSVVAIAISTPLLVLCWWFALRAARRWRTALVESNLQLQRQTAEREKISHQVDRFFTLSLDLLCIAGTDGYFKRLNPAFNQMLGHTTDELQARPFLDFIHPDDRPATLAEVAKLSQGEPTLQFENRYSCKDGSWRWLSWKCQPIPSEGLLYATGRDITEQKEAEAAIQRLNAELHAQAAQLDAANKELEAFSYSVSHDLRAPLRAVDGFSQALLEDYGSQLPEEGRHYLQTIRGGAQRMGVLIDDLLTFSRLSRLPLNQQAISMTGLAREALEELNGQRNGRQIDVRIGDLPSCEGDPALLKQVWVNLLSNAIKYTRKREAAVVDVGFREEKGENVYFVSDNGTGFDMKYAPKLFGVFQRLHRAEEFEGTGVGLAIVQRVVHRHGGQIWAQAAVNRGAEFCFTLKGMTQS